MEGFNPQFPPVPQPQSMPTIPSPAEQRSDVGFPSQKPPKKSGKIVRYLVAIVVLILIIVGGIWAVSKFSLGGGGNGDASPTPTTLSSFATPKPSATPTPSPTPEPKERSEVKIEILNGTGKAGEASFLKEAMEELGYVDVQAANSDTQDETVTTFSFDKDLSDEYVTEITKGLEDIYEEVRVRRTSIDEFDVRILTGPRKSSTAKTASDEDETAEETASPTPTPTATPAE